jgi:antitoxin HigA-1
VVGSKRGNDRKQSNEEDMNGMRPIHPGEILREEFVKPFYLTSRKLAKIIDVPHDQVSELVSCERDMTSDMARRLGYAFSMSPKLWLNLQHIYDVRLSMNRKENE